MGDKPTPASETWWTKSKLMFIIMNMEPLFDEINAEFHYQLTGEIEGYYKQALLDSLIEDIKQSPKYMGVIDNVVMLNSWLYVKIKKSVYTLPEPTRTRLMDNVFNLLSKNNTIQFLSINYRVN